MAPVVYVAEATSLEQADQIHRQVWNENVVPFLLVRLPTHVRLYSGFTFAQEPNTGLRGAASGVLEDMVAFANVLSRLSDFRASSIDNGAIWQSRGSQVNAEARVDRRLLRSLRELGDWLHHDQRIGRETAHAVIGKLVYLRYLRDREILSDWRLRQLGLDPEVLSSRGVNASSLQRLVNKVDDWLNGSVFPVDFRSLTAGQLQHVTDVFLGHETSGQLSLDFRAYHFGHLPIETLSIIYEQFLTVEGRQSTQGAYYTPVPVVNFMIGELENEHPLKNRIRILDPACGSGAFLVQCYRRLAETYYYQSGEKPKPSELRTLLVESIFGYDRDRDACRVTQLSLLLAMLDYIEPPDLNRAPTFKLPVLDHNVRAEDFFAVAPSESTRFDWIVGNPPWFQLSSSSSKDRSALRWVKRARVPITGNQIAEAFVWKALSHVAPSGAVSLLVPATTLFKKQRAFRELFFTRARTWFVANLSNLREVLFGGRARRAATAVFFRPLSPAALDEGRTSRDRIMVFCPLLINQQIAGSNRPGQLSESWTLLPDSAELQEMAYEAARSGDALPWKTLMWGSPFDLRLLQDVERRFSSLAEVATQRQLRVHQGVELREATSQEELEPHPELAGRFELRVTSELDELHHIPEDALVPIEPFRAYVRKRGGNLPLSVCHPPHVFVHATRNCAIYSDSFFVIPARQIGISGGPDQADFLRAMAAYLSSDFARYHQFLCSPEWGVTMGRATLDALRRIPIPLETTGAIQRLRDFQVQLARARSQEHASLQSGLNDAVFDLLLLSRRERYVVEDLVKIKMLARSGNVAAEHVRTPRQQEMQDYAEALREALDGFLDIGGTSLAHRVHVFQAAAAGVVRVWLANQDKTAPRVEPAEEDVAEQVKTAASIIQREHRQWMYFDRNLVVSREDDTYLFKPMQRIWWTQSQALLDAHDVVAAAMTPALS